MTHAPHAHAQQIKLPRCECLRCGYVWVPSVVAPKVCPACKNRKWKTAREPKKTAATAETVATS